MPVLKEPQISVFRIAKLSNCMTIFFIKLFYSQFLRICCYDVRMYGTRRRLRRCRDLGYRFFICSSPYEGRIDLFDYYSIVKILIIMIIMMIIIIIIIIMIIMMTIIIMMIIINKIIINILSYQAYSFFSYVSLLLSHF